MIIALTIWGDRISPVFDSSHMLLVTDTREGKIIESRFEPFEPVIPFLLSEKMRELKVEVLICGAISREPANLIESSDIELISFISGNAKNVLASYINGEVLSSKYIMPGCGRNYGGKVCRKGSGHGYGCRKINK